jgi:aminoglycoside 2'-N-acetyltransferase I
VPIVDVGPGHQPLGVRLIGIMTYPEHAVPTHLRLQVVRLQDLAWPSDGPPDPAPWHDPSLRPLSVMLVKDEDQVVSALDILSKEIVHLGQTYAASGISTMVTDPDFRSHGFGRQLAEAALEIMAANGDDLGIFTCDRELRRLYESAGWSHLPGSVLVGGSPEHPFPSDQFDKVTVASFFSARALLAAPQFIGARIELYPGPIDKLW